MLLTYNWSLYAKEVSKPRFTCALPVYLKNKKNSTETESEQETDPEPPSKIPKAKPEDTQASDASEDSDSGMEANDEGSEGAISAVQLLAARRDKLAHDKLRIGALCSSLLESPEKKVIIELSGN